MPELDADARLPRADRLDPEDQVGARKAVPSWGSISLFLLAMVMLLCVVAVLSVNYAA